MSAAVRVYGGAVLVCFGISWVVSLAWWLLLPDTRVIPLEIPPGTAAAIARGERVEVIPDALSLRRGDTLVVRNEDDAVHRLGSEMIPPSTTARIPVTSTLLDAPSLLCSIHPSGVLGVSTLARPGILTTAVPTVLAGVPASLVLIVAVFVARQLREDEEPVAAT